VPASLEELLARAMSKSPAARPSTALAFARALQVVEQELRLAMTDIEVPDTSWLGGSTTPADSSEGDGRTVVRAVIEVNPDGGPVQPARSAPAAEDRTVLRPVTEVDPDARRRAQANGTSGIAWDEDATGVTQGRPRVAPATGDEEPATRRRPTARVLVASAVA